MPALKWNPIPGAVVLVISAPIAPAGVPALCERVRMEGSAAEVIACDVGALVDPDALTVDAVARLTLTARRNGSHIRLLHVSSRLRELLVFVGLGDVVGLSRGLPPEAGGQTEEREQARGVEEEDDPGDPAG